MYEVGRVSISLQSIIHSYWKQYKNYKQSYIQRKVSVSLWSIIYSYLKIIEILEIWEGEFPSPYGVSFILIEEKLVRVRFFSLCYGFRPLAEYYSFLCFMAKKLTAGNLLGFPSSYGISFILILLATVGCYSLKLQAFPSPYGVSFILI